MKKISILIGIVCSILLSYSFAEKVPTHIHDEIYTSASQCDGGKWGKVFYLGSNGHEMVDTFTNTDQDYAWQINTLNSWVGVYNLGNVLSFSGGLQDAFDYFSNGKPHNVDTIVVLGAKNGVKVENIPSNYTRSQIAAQLVYHIYRTSARYTPGSMQTFQYLDYNNIAAGTQEYSFTPAFPFQNEEDNECLDIHVGFCGDGVLDNSQTEGIDLENDFSNINTSLKGEEECDPALASSIPAGATCTSECKIQYNQPQCNNVYNEQTHYGQNWLTSETPELCTLGNVVGFMGPNSGGGYMWSCVGPEGTTPANCSADENWCGDGLFQPQDEECDPNDGMQHGWGNGGCSATCEKINLTYDLALRKTVSTGVLIARDQIAFDITVYNQGELSAHDIKVADYYQIGELIYVSASVPTVVGNPGPLAVLQAENVAVMTFSGEILPGESRTERIVFKINPDYTGTEIRNYAEISEDDGNDIDSTPDYNSTNDCAVIDDEINETCPADEDDHDVAVVTLESSVYDLALRKTVSTGVLIARDQIAFDITVYNQGDVAAHDIKVADYFSQDKLIYVSSTVPVEMGNIGYNGLWIHNIVEMTRTGEILPGESRTETIIFKVNPNYTGTEIRNYAEISEDDGNDVDSTADTNPVNDCAVIDDEINETCPADEDDHDVVVVTLEPAGVEKLLISKKLISNGSGDIYLSGEQVKFAITVVNTGTVAVDNIVVKDFMPVSLDYVSSTVTSNQTGVVLEVLTGGNFSYSGLSLQPQEVFSFEVVGVVKNNPNQNETTNCASITSHNVGPVCDKFGLKPEVWLEKTQNVATASQYTGVVLSGALNDVIYYHIAFGNTGSSTAHNVTLTDYLPQCVNYVTGSADIVGVTGWQLTINNNTIKYYGFDLAPSQTGVMLLQANIVDTDSCAEYRNIAELQFGDTVLTDTVTVVPGEDRPDLLACNIFSSPSSMTIAEGQNGTANVTCSTSAGQIAKKIIIRCGNNTTESISANTNSYTFSCNYSNEGNYTPSCEVYSDDNVLDSTCTSSVNIDKEHEYYGECGDGRRDSGEDCDWGGEKKYLDDGDDKLFKYGSSYRDLEWFLDREDEEYDSDTEYYCTPGCRIKSKKDNKEDFIATIPRCLSNDAPISVQKGEKMPIWWRLEKSGIDIVDENDCSKRKQEKAQDDYKTLISQDDLECKFVVLDAKGKEVDHFTEKGRDCWKRATDEKNTDDGIYKFFFDTRYDEDGIASIEENTYNWFIHKANGKRVLDINDNDYERNGEYKVVLEEVRSQFCTPQGDWKDAKIYDRVCEVNFTVTEPYLIQKGIYGLFPTAASQGKSFFKNFYEMYEESALFNNAKFNKYLGDTTVVDDSDYTLTSALRTKIANFKKKYKKLALDTGRSNIKKVPGKNIFFVDGDMIISNDDEYVKTKYTIIVDGDVTVQGSITTNGMIVAKNIKFEDKSNTDFRCEIGGQTVQGIFIAEEGFEGDSKFNTDKDTERCNYGNLTVKGVLIGKDISTLVDQKRSHLNGWFWVESHKQRDVEIERRKEIFEGASVLVEYNPYLWTDLPPGASDFINAVDIYKK